MTKITLVAAVAQNGVIGRDGDLPWSRMARDMVHFRTLTYGHPVIMGRRTWESIYGRLNRPLDGRRNIVITSRAISIDGVEVVRSLADALAISHEADEVMVIGGAQLYREAVDVATRLQLTWVHAEVSGDVYFPVIDEEWMVVPQSVQSYPADERNEYAFTFVTYERRSSV